MHSLMFAAILFLSPATPTSAPALNACPNIDPPAVLKVSRKRHSGRKGEVLIGVGEQKPTKMTCDIDCSEQCWLEWSSCGDVEGCDTIYYNCICQNHCCTPEDEPAYCQ